MSVLLRPRQEETEDLGGHGVLEEDGVQRGCEVWLFLTRDPQCLFVKGTLSEAGDGLRNRGRRASQLLPDQRLGRGVGALGRERTPSALQLAHLA